MNRPLFQNPAYEADFVRDGYVKVPFTDPAFLQSILAEFVQLDPADKLDPESHPVNPLNVSSYHCTFLDVNPEYKQQVQDIIFAQLEPVIANILAGFKLLAGNFYVKPPGKGTFQIHQNWPVADYRHTSLTVWIPLQDTTATNGTLHVVKGSHKVVPDIASPLTPPFFAHFEDALIERYLEPVEVKLGEAVIFCDSLIHWSPQNNSSEPRVAIQIETFPAECDPLLYIYNRAADAFDLYPVDNGFFVAHSMDAVLQAPPGREKIGSIPNPNKVLTEAEFRQYLQDGPAVRAALYAGAPVDFNRSAAATAAPRVSRSRRLWRRLRRVFS